ncbi:MAG: VIT1/CCC1 transporter family protein [Candidatus Nanohaloarchaea archaeon]
MQFKETIKEFKEVFGKEEVKSISRRYFVSNGFDGTLTSIGITVGSYLSGVSTGITVFKVGMGAAIGLATSGVWSVWEIERAEKRAELKDLEKHMQKDLSETRLYEDKKKARMINSFMSGLGPTLAVFLVVSPFLLEETILSMFQATLASVGMGMSLLFVLGAYMGNISDQNLVKAGIRMALAGLIVAILNVVLPG